MANALYDPGRDDFAKGAINWPADTIKAVLVDTAAYAYSATHASLASVPAAARVATVALTGKATTGAGAVDAADTTFPNVPDPQPTVEAVVVYRQGADEASSRLIAYIDVAPGLPVDPNGGDITVVWDDGPLRIFRL